MRRGPTYLPLIIEIGTVGELTLGRMIVIIAAPAATIFNSKAYRYAYEHDHSFDCYRLIVSRNFRP
jgi:hypothetical protein